MKEKLESSRINQHQTFDNDNRKLILWNDDDNYFEFVISSISEICGFNDNDSINIVLDCHNDGCSEITSGDFESLLLLQEEFLHRHINASLE